MKRFYNVETQKVITMKDVFKSYQREKENNDFLNDSTFERFLELCMIENNGSLKEITKR